MSIQQQIEIVELQKGFRDMIERLDNLEKNAKLLADDMSHLMRQPATKSGVRLPPTALPQTLEKLELGKQPKGV